MDSFKNYLISILYLFNVIELDQGLSLELITQSAGNQLDKIDLAHTLSDDYSTEHRHIINQPIII